jgi:hypothetical protein
MHRLNAYTRPSEIMLESVKKYSTLRDGVFELLSVDKIMKYKVIVSTMQSASYLYGMGVPRGHFTVFNAK